MFSSIRSVCFCHVFSDLATFETQLNILLFFKSLLLLPFSHSISLSLLTFSLYLGFRGLCSILVSVLVIVEKLLLPSMVVLVRSIQLSQLLLYTLYLEYVSKDPLISISVLLGCIRKANAKMALEGLDDEGMNARLFRGKFCLVMLESEENIFEEVPVTNPQHRKKEVVKDIPKGFLPIKVGQGEEQQKIVMPIMYLNHPLFSQLLKEAEEEYGFDQQGTIIIPCLVKDFRYVQDLIHKDISSHRCFRPSLR
ncbi:hypothetical protein VNO78_25057 [Psophocarpus tetragonolobus]|uniref:Small auxin up regulated protein n=1 Tax=Psophocarpus tetragonolobus TaxID=3891 RepID=A0AAN9S556_PSOTE